MLVGTVCGLSQDFTVRQAIDYALKNHHKISQNQLEIADATQNVREYTAIGMPKLSGSAQYQYFVDIPTSIIPTGSFFAGDPALGIPPNPSEDLAVQFGVRNIFNAGLNLDILVFDGSFFVGLQAARLYRELVSRQTEVTHEELAYGVSKAFVGVLLAQRNKGLLEKNIANITALLSETREIYQQGFAEKIDADRLALSLNNLMIELSKMDNALVIAKNVLKFSMGYPLAEPIDIAGTLEDMIVDQEPYLAMAADANVAVSRREYLALETASELNELNIKRLQYQYLPVLRAFGTYGQVLQGNKLGNALWFPTTIIGLSLQLPIFDGFEKKAKVDRARISRDQHLVTMDQYRQGVGLEVENARLSYLNAQNSVLGTQRSVDLAEEIYRISSIKYREGVGSSLELNQAEADWFAAQAQHTSAIYQLMVAQLDFHKAVGRLL